MEVKLRTVIACAFLWIGIHANACSLAGLEFEPKFPPSRSQLSETEILRFAEWMAQKARDLPSGGHLGVFVRRNARAGVGPQLAESRRVHLNGLLLNFGIAPADIEFSEVEDYGLDLAVVPPLLDLMNTAAVVFNPKCPHPCCPGPTPIERDTPAR